MPGPDQNVADDMGTEAVISPITPGHHDENGSQLKTRATEGGGSVACPAPIGALART
jgi:hypothetical protein